MEDIGYQRKQLGQSRPSGTSAASIYSPADASIIGVIDSIWIAETAGTGAAVYSLYYDSDGTTYDQSTALAYQQIISANGTVVFEPEVSIPLTDAGNLAVQSSVGNAITFTVFGRDKKGA